jgi:hypothetical protein
LSKSLRRKLHLARSLSALEWFILLEAWLALFVFSLALRLVSAERLGIPSTAGQGHALPIDGFTRAERLHRLVEIAARLHWPVRTCLPRALSLRWMLSRRVIACDLRIGVQRVDDKLQAHAWIEVASQSVGESLDNLGRFHAFVK